MNFVAAICCEAHYTDRWFQHEVRVRTRRRTLLGIANTLRPAAIAAGVRIESGARFGLHNLQHSLSNWLVNKTKVELKIVQGILRHSKAQTTLDLYAKQEGDETLAAQGKFLTKLIQ